MAAHDTSWDIFRSELKHWMSLRRCTNRALAHNINENLASAGLSAPVDEQIIKRWRHSTSPPLQALKVIAHVLAMSGDPTGQAPYDPTYLPRVMGILDQTPENTELIEAAYRLQDLRARISDAQTLLTGIHLDEGVPRIVRAARNSGLGAAVLPVYEGPIGYEMRVSDRIDLRDARPGMPAPDPADHPELAAALRDAFAVVSRRLPRFGAERDLTDGVSPWAIQYLGRPRMGLLGHSHTTVGAIAITSVTGASWLDDVGDLVALVLGYGFASARELARELVSDPYTAHELRTDIHENFLSAAVPQQRVWTHEGAGLTSGGADAPFRDKSGNVQPGIIHVFLNQDDASLERSARHPAGTARDRTDEEAAAVLKSAIATRDEALARARRIGPGQRVYVVDVPLRTRREERWEQVFQSALAVLRIIESQGAAMELGDLHDRLVVREPALAPTVLRWFADHGAPFVEPRFGSAPAPT